MSAASLIFGFTCAALALAYAAWRSGKDDEPCCGCSAECPYCGVCNNWEAA